MKTISFLLVLIAVCFSCNDPEETATIHINQLGYYPRAVKKAIVVESQATEFEVKTIDGETLFKGALSDAKYWDKSGENVKIADFSTFVKKGRYILQVGGAKSCQFEIKENLYKEAFKATLKNYYHIRASMDLDEKYAGKWNRKAGHPDTLCYFHPSALRGEGTMSSPGGWYDAGDPNKYVVNGGVTVGTLLNFYEMYPEFVGDNFTNIPESGNGFSDLLDEAKYELDWVLTMQAPDGGSHLKLTHKGFGGFIMPETDTVSRFVVGKGTAPSLNMAAITAQASRLYKDHDSEFAKQCLTTAEKAWKWAVENPNVVYKNPKDVVTGQYGDSDFTEEFWWAAAELYLATKKQEYADYLSDNEAYVKMEVSESWRQFLGNIGSFSLLLADSTDNAELKENLKNKLITLADSLYTRLKAIPYHIAIDNFQWGSNSDVLNSAVIFAYAYNFSNNEKYLDAVIETADYVFGKNATGYSFVTGFGCKQAMFPHNRVVAADGIDEPTPGFIVGGPNNNREDDISKSEWGVVYQDTLPAKSYIDKQGSYASNETCINWNAPAVFVLGFLEANAKKFE